jgi:hypothetical protein
VEYAEFDWRPFRIPWVYTLDQDILASPKAPPDPTSLRWTEVPLTGADDEVVYEERPDVWPLDTNAMSGWPQLTDASWQGVQTARDSALLSRPVAHFLLRAFRADGIDEVLDHITAVEAALALPRDHFREPGAQKRRQHLEAHPDQPVPWRPRLSDGSNPSATDRLALRIANLLGSECGGEEFRALYRARSDFLHGSTMQSIPAAQRLGARRLARRVSAELIRRAADDPQLEREPFLSSLCP